MVTSIARFSHYYTAIFLKYLKQLHLHHGKLVYGVIPAFQGGEFDYYRTHSGVYKICNYGSYSGKGECYL